MTSILGSLRRQVSHLGHCGPVGYLVTVCTADGRPSLGCLDRAGVLLNTEGRIVWEEWQAAERTRPDIVLDSFAVLPSHLRGIVWVVPDQATPAPGAALREFLEQFVSNTDRRVNRLRGTPGQRMWGLDHQARIIRDPAFWRDLRRCLEAHPPHWSHDPGHRHAAGG